MVDLEARQKRNRRKNNKSVICYISIIRMKICRAEALHIFYLSGHAISDMCRLAEMEEWICLNIEM